MPHLSRVAPEIPVADLREAIGYYEGKLGFRVVMQMPSGDYAVLERDDIALHLFADRGRAHSPVGIHIFSNGLDELEAEFAGRGALLSQSIMRKPWGNRDFRINDPFGNQLKFSEPLDGEG